LWVSFYSSADTGKPVSQRLIRISKGESEMTWKTKGPPRYDRDSIIFKQAGTKIAIAFAGT